MKSNFGYVRGQPKRRAIVSALEPLASRLFSIYKQHGLYAMWESSEDTYRLAIEAIAGAGHDRPVSALHEIKKAVVSRQISFDSYDLYIAYRCISRSVYWQALGGRRLRGAVYKERQHHKSEKGRVKDSLNRKEKTRDFRRAGWQDRHKKYWTRAQRRQERHKARQLLRNEDYDGLTTQSWKKDKWLWD